MNAEMQSMYDNKVWRLAVLPPNAKVVKKMKRMQNVPYALVVGSIMYAVRATSQLYCDAGFETDRDDMKSQTGYVFVLNGGAVVWKSSKQSTTTQHATEAEYIAASEAAKEAIKMNCDNSAAIIMAKESGIQKGARHFKRKYHYVRECIETGKIDIVKVNTDENLADPFTKALAGPKLTRHTRSMGLHDILADPFTKALAGPKLTRHARSTGEVIQNGNKVLKRIVGTVEQIYKPTSAEEKLDKRNEMKARGTLLMSLPNKDQLKFHSYKDAKLLMKATEKRCGENKESKKVQRTLLKQQYENFAASSSKTLDRSKVECFNCHKNGHFVKECGAPKNQENRGREYDRKTLPMENPTKNALIAQDGIKGYDRSYQAKEELPTNYALMALTSSGSSSSLDFEVDSCSRTCIKAYDTLKEQYDSLSSDYKKSQFNLVSYKAGLQSVEEILAHYKKNEAVFKEKINILNLEVKLRDNALVENIKKLEKAEKERDGLKLTLEKF
nr:hypothetical protein [Tanacetum cinerariifolium]